MKGRERLLLTGSEARTDWPGNGQSPRGRGERRADSRSLLSAMVNDKTWIVLKENDSSRLMKVDLSIFGSDQTLIEGSKGGIFVLRTAPT
jgi:hypothetical protein